MKTLLALIVGILIGVAVMAYLRGERGQLRSQRETPSESLTNQSASTPLGEGVQDKLSSLKLRGEDIKDELARTGRVMRQKAEQAGRTITDATADARATAAIKAKLLADPDLSALSISVNTTEGVVTLSGTVSSEDNIGKAMLLAMEVDSVHEVVSTLQVKPNV